MAEQQGHDSLSKRPAETTLALKIRRTESLASLVRKELERMIVSGELTGGERLNENALADRLGVSRGPIREACRGLEQSGLVEVVVNRGTFVRQIDLRAALGIYDVRSALFGLAGRLLAAQATPALVTRLAELVDAMDRASTDLDAYYPLNVAYHAALIEGCNNEHLAATYRNLAKELHLFRRRGLVPEASMKASNHEHRAILDAIRARDSGKAQALMEAHILAGKARLIKMTEAEAAARLARAAGRG
ncbi:MAG: FCD domain-containing protein [Alphaproteobacteria bacterium]|nr:FCD domain-containing protein [Alphaproteobacteria bacterium]